VELTNSEQAALAARNAELEAEVRDLRELVHSERFRALNQWELKLDSCGSDWNWHIDNGTIQISCYTWCQRHKTRSHAEAEARAIAKLFGIRIAESEDNHD
jgi:hypothetical protein